MPVMPPEVADMYPYFGLDRDEFSFIRDFDILIQESIADRVDGNEERARIMDNQRGFYQAFALNANVQLFYNEPPTPDQEDVGNPRNVEDNEIDQRNGDDQVMAHEEEGEQGVMQEHQSNSNDNMGSTGGSSWTTEEWPSQGWDTYDHNSLVSEDGSPIDVAGLFNNCDYNSDDHHDMITDRENLEQQAVTQGAQETTKVLPYQQVEASWEVLASSVIGNYKMNQGTVSDSGAINVVQGKNDFWKRIPNMPRFKRKGSKSRTNIRERNWIKTNAGGAGKDLMRAKKKRKASSDPGVYLDDLSEADSAQSASSKNILSASKRFCAEGRRWLTSLGNGEGTSRQKKGKNGKGRVEFMIEYEDENQVCIESMIDSTSDMEEKEEACSKDEEDNSDDKAGFAGVRQKQPPNSS